MFQRSAGVLMHISSLPGPYGIGDFGEGFRAFVDLLHEMRMGWWQILPLCPVGMGDSPYSSYSVFALNPLFVSPQELVAAGLVTQEQAKAAEYMGSPYSTAYAFTRESKARLLRQAYENMQQVERQVAAFSAQQAYWLEDYAMFMAGREANGGLPWWEWAHAPQPEAAAYYRFEQYVLRTQWEAAHAYARRQGVRILGDMPIYVSRDSAELKGRPGLFQTDENGAPTHVAGVPPDYFAKDGQLWGNPLYDWDAMEKDGYQWWLSRIGCSLELYDAVRIDHFRGFHRYWAVPAQEVTAVKGVWKDGPGMRLFDKVRQTYGDAAIVAEDLGAWDQGLKRFLLQAGYPGMKVMQFGFSTPDSDHAPHRYTEQSVAYTGTHDNNTILGWLWETPAEEKKRLLQYCRYAGENWGEGGGRSEVIRAIITTLWQTGAGIAIVPVQDMCGFGADTRMNIPGEADGNWKFRMAPDTLQQIDTVFYRELNTVYARG